MHIFPNIQVFFEKYTQMHPVNKHVFPFQCFFTVTLNTYFTIVLVKPEQMFSLLNIYGHAGYKDTFVSLIGQGAVVRGLRMGQPVPLTLLFIPIINLPLLDEPIRYPGPATQGSIYLID